LVQDEEAQPHTYLGAPHSKAHFRFLRKLKDFKPYGPKNTVAIFE